MATHTVSALYERYDDAAAAVAKLEAAGVPHDDISLVGNRGEEAAGTGDGGHAATGAGTGATLGTLIGGGAGLLAGLGLMAIPGVGPVVAAGWLVSTLTGAGIGAAAGGLVGSLTGAGVSEADAQAYAEGVRRGGTLLTVRTDEARTAAVERILEDHGALDLDERQEGWKRSGWTGGDTATLRGSDAAAGTSGAVPGGAGRVVPPAGDTSGDRSTLVGSAAAAGPAAGAAPSAGQGGVGGARRVRVYTAS